MFRLTNMRFFPLVFFTMAACHETTPAPKAGALAPAPVESGSPSVHNTITSELPAHAGGCGNIEFYAADADRKRILRIYLDGKGLKLSQGRHRLSVLDTKHVTVEMAIFTTAPGEIPECNDIGEETLIAEKWSAESGEVVVDIPALPTSSEHDPTWSVTVEVENLTLKNSKGERRTYSKRYDPVRVGWYPG